MIGFDPSVSLTNLPDPDDAPVLVVVVNDPLDMQRVRDEGWYRIPLARLPHRVAAEYLAFYQTGAFPPGQRWTIQWLAPVRSYRVATRRELIPDERDHPRSNQLYYKIALGPLRALARPIPSRRLRRITFIATTLARLHQAEEINDLWIKSSAQERLWLALKQAGVAAERQYPLGLLGDEEGPEDGWLADLAVPDDDGGGTALVVTDEPGLEDTIVERRHPLYAPAGWRVFYTARAELGAELGLWLSRLIGQTAL